MDTLSLPRPMLVYRVENRLGYGAYRVGDTPAISPPVYHSRPSPWWEHSTLGDWFSEHPSEFRKQYYFGFVSARQAYEWFHDPMDWDRMANLGLKLAVYSVPASLVVLGEYQLVFHRDSAKLLRWYPFDLFRWPTAPVALTDRNRGIILRHTHQGALCRTA